MPGPLHILLPVLPIVACALMGHAATPSRTLDPSLVHPIELFRVGGQDYLAACNTPENSVEIWETSQSRPTRRVALLQVGLDPVSVRYNPSTESLYTANLLGDSISVIRVAKRPTSSGIRALLQETTWVGGEPLDLAFFTWTTPQGVQRETLFISHRGLERVGWRDALTLAPVHGPRVTLHSFPRRTGNPLPETTDGPGQDPASRQQFASAFEALLGGSEMGQPRMSEFEDFIAAVHSRPLRRRLNVAFTAPDDVLEIQVPETGRSERSSCRSCHTFGNAGPAPVATSGNRLGPIESAALRPSPTRRYRMDALSREMGPDLP